MTENRNEKLLNEALQYIAVHTPGEEAYRFLHSQMGISNEDLMQYGLNDLREYFQYEWEEGTLWREFADQMGRLLPQPDVHTTSAWISFASELAEGVETSFVLEANMSTALAQMNTFMDIALEQVICFDSNIDAEKFTKEKTAIFLVLPEEDRTKNFMAGLMIQNLSKELFELAEKGKGRLPNRVVFFCDEFGTMPAFDVEALFSAGRSRGITLVPIIQSLAQLEKNYGREGAEILTDNCQDTIFGGFAPNSQTAEQLSKSLGSRTVLSGSVSRGKNDPSQSLQMMERPLMTPDELKSIPKGSFVVMKTGTHPMQTKLRLFLDWGITFDATYATPEHAARSVAYASRQELFLSIGKRYSRSSDQPVQAQQASTTQRRAPRSAMGLYSEDTRP